MAKVVAIDYTRSLSVGEVAKRSGVAVSTIHFYESKGLIKATRSEGNQRRFSGIVLRYIAIIKVAQRWHTHGRDPRRAGRAAARQQTDGGAVEKACRRAGARRWTNASSG